MTLSPSRRAVAAIGPQATRDLFFHATVTDFSGKGTEFDIKGSNFHTLRETRHVPATRASARCSSAPAGAFDEPSSPTCLTSYGKHFSEKPLLDFEANKELAAIFHREPNGQAPPVSFGDGCSSYRTHFMCPPTKGGRGAAQGIEPEQEDHVRGLLGVGSPIESQSFSQWQHRGLPGFKGQNFLPRDTLGVLESPPRAKDFWETRYRLEFQSSQPRWGRKQPPMRKSATTKKLPATAGSADAAERTLRSSLMRSQYQRSFSASVLAQRAPS